VDIANTPDLIRFYGDQARVSLKKTIYDNYTIKFVLSIVGGVPEHVPSSKT